MRDDAPVRRILISALILAGEGGATGAIFASVSHHLAVYAAFVAGASLFPIALWVLERAR